MRYVFDHDFHIHSQLSECSSDPLQNPQRILQYAIDNHLKQICLTDHFWDETVPGAWPWYVPQNYPHICQSKPLPQAENVEFLFGCETELSKNLVLAISPKVMEEMDFIVIPTNHFHMKDCTISLEDGKNAAGRAKCWFSHLNYVLSQDLPFHKIGIAHLTETLIAPTREMWMETLHMLDRDELYASFKKAAALGVGIELNGDDMAVSMENNGENEEAMMRVYRIAKECGCKFYCGSDAHHPDVFLDSKKLFNYAIDTLELEEKDKFHIEK